MINKKCSYITNSRNNEKGIALVTVVLLLMLLMVVCGAIILITSVSNITTIDAVAEKQAMRAAETGMQRTLNLLRGNGNGEALSFKKAAIRTLSNTASDWVPYPRLSKWLNYNYPSTQPDRVTLTSGYTPANGLAFSVKTVAPDAIPSVVPTPNPNFVDGPVIKPESGIKPDKPSWHPWNCAHCSWDYTHCSMYNPPNNGTYRGDGYGCRHKHCTPPAAGTGANDGYQRLLIKVTGYGPRGAKKELELMVKIAIFELEGEPLIFMRGTSDTTTANLKITDNPEVKFNSNESIAFTLTKNADIDAIKAKIDLDDKVKIEGKGDDFEIETDFDYIKWLKTADEAKNLVNDLEQDAKARERYFTSYPTGNAGTDKLPKFTFISGNAELSGDGAGLLVVTGNLTINKNFKYKGLVLLLGQGRLDVTGGDSKIEGAIVMAKFGLTDDFMQPTINLSGYGKFEAKYEKSKIEAAKKLINLRIQAVRQE